MDAERIYKRQNRELAVKNRESKVGYNATTTPESMKNTIDTITVV